MKDQALQFLKNEELCVISTMSSDGRPQSALVAFSENEKLEIMIGTSKKSRKFKNIAHNPHVSIVFGPKDRKAIQYEGVARELKNKELTEKMKHHFKKHPGALKYESDPTQTYILVEPKWIRMVESGPTVIEELRFD